MLKKILEAIDKESQALGYSIPDVETALEVIKSIKPAYGHISISQWSAKSITGLKSDGHSLSIPTKYHIGPILLPLRAQILSWMLQFFVFLRAVGLGLAAL